MKFLKSYLAYFLSFFVVGHIVFKVADLPLCFDPFVLRILCLACFILLLIMAASKIIWGVPLVLVAMAVGLTWASLHTGETFVSPDHRERNRALFANFGDLDPDYRMSYRNCTLRPVKTSIKNGEFFTLKTHYVKDRLGLFGIGEVRSLEKTADRESQSILGQLRSYLRGRIYRLIESPNKEQEKKLENWFLGILLGSHLTMPADVKAHFQITGLYHLLSVGGLHIAVVVGIIKLFLRLPFSLVYCFCLIPKPTVWPKVWAFLEISTGVIIYAFMLVVGCDPAIQRSVIVFAFLMMSQLFWGPCSRPSTYLLCLSLQALLFPIGFLSEGNFMSWLCSVRIWEEYGRKRRHIWWKHGFKIFALQMELTVYGAAFFGHLSLLGLVMNPFFVGAFSALFVLSAVVILFDWMLMTQFSMSMVQSFLLTIEWASSLVVEFPWIYLNLGDFSWWVRGVFVLLTGFFVLNLLQKKSMLPKGGYAHERTTLEAKENYYC